MKSYFRYNDKDSVENLAQALKPVVGENPVYFCMGSDKLVFDRIGPKVGTRLKERSNGSIIVYGVEGDAINARNAQKAYRAVKHLHPNSKIIAIDGALGNDTGTIRIKRSGIRPASRDGKDFGLIGDESVICTIFKDCPKMCKVLETVIDLLENLNVHDSVYYERLARYKRIEEFVNAAADTIADAILLASA